MCLLFVCVTFTATFSYLLLSFDTMFFSLVSLVRVVWILKSKAINRVTLFHPEHTQSHTNYCVCLCVRTNVRTYVYCFRKQLIQCGFIFSFHSFIYSFASLAAPYPHNVRLFTLLLSFLFIDYFLLFFASTLFCSSSSSSLSFLSFLFVLA